MTRRWLVVPVVLLTLVACGGQSPPAPTATSAPPPARSPAVVATSTTAAAATSAPDPTPAPTTAPTLEPVDTSAGLALYQAKGCVACHTLDAAGATAAVGPTHNGLAMTAAARITAADYEGSATTPAEYIAESVRTPDAYIVPGFSNIMTPFGPSVLSDEELGQLVLFLLNSDS